MKFCLVLLHIFFIINIAQGDHDYSKEHADIGKRCPETEYDFGEGEHIEYLLDIPKLKEATICTFIKTNEDGIIPGIVSSYGTDTDKELILIQGEALGKVRSLTITVEGKTRQIPVPLSPDTEYHICIVIDTQTGETKVYINGDIFPVTIKSPNMQPLPGGGKLLIGKAQHDESIIFTGKIRNFMMWDRALHQSTIGELYISNKCTGDEVVVLRPEHVLFHGLFVYKEECPHSDYTFNNGEGSEEYLQVLTSIPEMKFSTTCVWITTDENGLVPGTIASYTVGDKLDVVLVEGFSSGKLNSMRRALDGEIKISPSGFQPSTEYLICAQHFFPRKEAKLYIDGKFVGVTKFQNIGPSTPGGGIGIFGQRQGCSGGCFDKMRAFNGRIQNYTTWGRILSSDEIKAVYKNYSCPIDHVFNLRPENVLPHGTLFSFEKCPQTEYIFNNGPGSEEYLQILPTIPEMKFSTSCVWVTTDEMGGVPGTVGSYTVEDKLDVVLMEGFSIGNVNSMRSALHGEIKINRLRSRPSTDYFICEQHFFPWKEAHVYINTKLVGVTKYENIGSSTPGGGVAIIGQRQGCSGGCFDKKRAFRGRIRNFMVWSRILSTEDMMAIYKRNLCPVNHVLDLLPKNVLPHGELSSYVECPSTTYNLRNKGKSLQYVEVKKPLQLDENFTICVKITTDETGTIPGTIASYANNDKIDTLSITGLRRDYGPQSLRLSVHGQEKLITMLLRPSTEYSFCLAYNLPKNSVLTYVNGESLPAVEFSSLGAIPAHGKLIIGQQQTCLRTCFDSKYAFNGKMRNFMIWNRSLSKEEITGYSMSDKCPTDHLLDLTPAYTKFVKKSP